jgi:hypothetical protein
MAFANFPAQLVPLIQQNFLARFLEEGLDSEAAYRRHAILEQIPARLGQTLTMSKTGRKSPVTAVTNPANVTVGLDNGLTPSLASVEQYTYNVVELAAASDVDIMGELAGIADQLKTAARNNGVQAAQSLERLAKSVLFAAYNGGNSFVRTDLGESSSTTCHVDDVRGFTQVMVNGQFQPVSMSNPLIVNEISVDGGVTQTLTVTGVSVDAVTQSLYPSDEPGVSTSAGQSGVLTFESATDPVAGDALIAANAPLVLRPAGKTATTALQSGDNMTLNLLLSAVQQLRANAVPVFPDGTYHLVLDNMSLLQLFSDQQFIIATAAQFKAEQYMTGQIFVVYGCTVIPTTEAYVQTTSAAQIAGGVSVTVRRPILMGAESLLQGNFEGLEFWLNRDGFEPIGNVMLVDGIAQILRPPLDRLQRMASLAWTWIGAFAVPTDMTATPAVIPTASNAVYKRCVVMETAG